MSVDYELNAVLVGVDEIHLLGYDDGATTHDEDWLTLQALIDVDPEYESLGVLGLRLDGVDHFFQMLEDPSDGYRSYFGAAVCRTRPNDCVMQFEHAPPRVRIAHEDTTEDTVTTSVVSWDDDHVWLEFGTDNTDDYYPMAFCRWHPKEEKER